MLTKEVGFLNRRLSMQAETLFPQCSKIICTISQAGEQKLAHGLKREGVQLEAAQSAERIPF
jgi:hypothetical protein